MMAVTLRIVAKTLFDADVEAEVEAIGRAMHVSVRRFTRAMYAVGAAAEPPAAAEQLPLPRAPGGC